MHHMFDKCVNKVFTTLTCPSIALSIALLSIKIWNNGNLCVVSAEWVHFVTYTQYLYFFFVLFNKCVGVASDVTDCQVVRASEHIGGVHTRAREEECFGISARCPN